MLKLTIDSEVTLELVLFVVVTILHCQPFHGSGLVAVFAVVARDQERQLQRLLLVESRIAVGSVVQAQVIIVKTLASASAFCDRVSSKLEMHATQEGTMLLVDLEG